MNENQYDAYVATTRARTHFAIKRAEMAKARRELRTALEKLHKTIANDPQSWKDTPNVEELQDDVAVRLSDVQEDQ